MNDITDLAGVPADHTPNPDVEAGAAMPGNALDFAAKWNATPVDERDDVVRRINEAATLASNCFVRNHENGMRRLNDLTVQHSDTVNALNAARTVLEATSFDLPELGTVVDLGEEGDEYLVYGSLPYDFALLALQEHIAATAPDDVEAVEITARLARMENRTGWHRWVTVPGSAPGFPVRPSDSNENTYLVEAERGDFLAFEGVYFHG